MSVADGCCGEGLSDNTASIANKSAAYLTWRRGTMPRSQAASSDSDASLPARRRHSPCLAGEGCIPGADQSSLGGRGSSSFTPQRRFTPYTPHTPPLLPYPVYPVYPRGEDIPRIPPCSGYTPYTLLFWIYPVYPVYPIYPIYPVYPACADLPRFTPISDPLAALSDIFSPNNCAKPIARIERASRSRSAATPS